MRPSAGPVIASRRADTNGMPIAGSGAVPVVTPAVRSLCISSARETAVVAHPLPVCVGRLRDFRQQADEGG